MAKQGTLGQRLRYRLVETPDSDYFIWSNVILYSSSQRCYFTLIFSSPSWCINRSHKSALLWLHTFISILESDNSFAVNFVDSKRWNCVPLSSLIVLTFARDLSMKRMYRWLLPFFTFTKSDLARFEIGQNWPIISHSQHADRLPDSCSSAGNAPSERPSFYPRVS